MKKTIINKIASLLVVPFLFVACASSTNIRSTDPEAKIYVDGEYKGKGNATHQDTKIVGSSTSVRLEKAGCQARNFTFSRTEEFDVGACAGGVFVTIPFLWIMKYKPERTYEFTCEKI